MASPLSSSMPRTLAPKTGKLTFNVDAVAIAAALLLAVLVRLDVLPRIGW